MATELGVSTDELPPIAAISPVTAEAAREAGLNVQAVAAEYTWPGLLQTIVEQIAEEDTESQ